MLGLLRAAIVLCALTVMCFSSDKAFAARSSGEFVCTQHSCGASLQPVYSYGERRSVRRHAASKRIPHRARVDRSAARIVAHPSGCPRVRFCGCGVSVRVFGRPVRDLYLADNWRRFPRTSAAAGMVAWRPGHVFYIEQVHADGTATVYDPNSGGHLTRVYRTSVAGLRIVNPRTKSAEAPKLQLASADPAQVIVEEERKVSEPIGVSLPTAREIEVNEARRYLKSVAAAGGTAIRQGIDAVMTRLHATLEAPDIIAAFREALASGQVRDTGIGISIDRLHPDYAVKLAAATKEARASGLPEAHPFSCYRPPAYRVGGMRDKSASCHAYGLVCDMGGIGSARSADSRKWAKIATSNGLYRPFKSAWEYNHWQLVPHKVCGTPALRATINANGPKDLQKMWAAGTRLASTTEVLSAKKKRYAKRRHHHGKHLKYAAVH